MPTKSKTVSQGDKLVEAAVKGWSDSWSYRESSYHQNWKDCWALYNSQRIDVGYNGISDTFVPIPYSIIETMVSASSGERPTVEFIPTRPDQEANTEVLNQLFAYYWDLDSWTNKMIQRDRVLYLYGTSILHPYWDIDRPRIKVIPLRDFYIDTSATISDYHEAEFAGYRFLTTKKALGDEKIADPETGELIPKFKNLNKIDAENKSSDTTDREEKEIMMGASQDTKDMVEVLVHWTKDTVTYVANRNTVIRHADNPYRERQQFLGYENPEGILPFVADALSPDESLFYGKSALDPIKKPVELLNDLTNQNVDAVSWALDPIMELDPMYADYMDKMKNVTGAVYPFKPGSYSPVRKDIVPTNMFNERTNIKNEIREATGVDEVLTGIFGGDRTTATEVKAQTAAAGRRFSTIIAQLEGGGYYRLAKLVFQMIQMYVQTPIMFRVVGETGVEWREFNPEQFQGDYEPRIKLAVRLREEKNQKMRNLKEAFSAFLGAPGINPEELSRIVVQKAFDLDREDVARVTNVQPQPPREEPPEIKYRDAPEDVKAQMEMKAGFEPSQTHGATMETEYAKRNAELVKQQAEAAKAFMRGDDGGLV